MKIENQHRVVMMLAPLTLAATFALALVFATLAFARPTDRERLAYEPLGTFKTENLLVDKQAGVGSPGPSTYDQMSINVSGAATAATSQAGLDIESNDTGHTGPGGPVDNEQINLVIRNNTTFDCTSKIGEATAIDIALTSTCSMGGMGILPIGIANQVTTPGGYDYYSLAGTMRHDGAVTFNSSPDVALGVHVENFGVVPQTPALTVPQLDIGTFAPTDGYNMHITNTTTGVAGMGIAMAGNTTVSATIAPQITIYRNNTGSFGGDFALICVDNGGSCGTSAANNMVVANYFTGKDLYLQAKASVQFGSPSNTATHLTKDGHWVQDFSFGLPSLDAGCTSGGGSSVVGNDNRFELTTGATSTACTATFAKTWTTKPICNITTEGGIALPTYTVSATAITITTNVNSGVYNVDCQGQPGST